MKTYTAATIGAALLAVLTTAETRAQGELPSRPDPSAPVAQPTPPAPATVPYVAPRMPGRYPRHVLGIELGWGAPYGWGVQYAYLATPNLDVNAGLGLGVGGKIGVGARYYLHPERRVTPYFGANLTRTGRIDNMEMTLTRRNSGGSYNEKAIFSIRPCGLLHLRGGMRWQPGTVGILGTLGYGVRLSGDPVVFDTFAYGPPSPDMRNLVQTISAGGLEVSLGVFFSLDNL